MAEEPSEKERRLFLSSLTGVGPTKPVGYLPLDTIKNFIRLSPESIATSATARGLATVQFGPEECCIKSGALYVYHRGALADFLQAQAEAAAAGGLPLDPERFIAHIATVWFDMDHPACAIIRKAFADNS